MRLLVVSHACVMAVNQALYSRVAALTGWEVDIMVPARWRNEYGRQRPQRVDGFHGQLMPLPVLLAGNIPLHTYVARLRHRLRALAPDAIYLHHEPYAIATAQFVLAARSAVPKAPIGIYSAQSLVKHYLWPITAAERMVHRHADFALPVSEEVAEALRAKGYKGRVDVLPLAVNVAALRPDEAAEPRVGTPTIGYVGRLATEKGVDTLLEAMSRLGAHEARALIVGEGADRGRLERLSQALGLGDRVEWPGYVPHDRVASEYRRMDVLVVPSRTVSSWKEQFGRIVIEALACGVPVLVSDSGELPRLIERTGGGWVVAEGDADALAAALRSVLPDREERVRRGAAGRAYVERELSLDAIAARFASVVSEVLEAHTMPMPGSASLASGP